MVGLAVAQLRYHRRRTLLAVVGVALAVVLVTTMVGTGYGLATTGDEAISWINRDLWVSGGTLSLAPGSVGGVENPVENSHRVSQDIESRSAVESATPLAFQAVYVSPNDSEFQTVVGVGIGVSPNDSAAKRSGASFSVGDAHYANGRYDGPMTHEVVIAPRTAERFDVGVNDTLYIGGTIAQARNNEFRVVGITSGFSTFLGTPTVTLPLSELQEVTGTTGTDRAALIAVTLSDRSDPSTVARGIERDHPGLTVRTNDQQVQRIVGRQVSLVAGAVALVGLALVAGLLLVLNSLALLVYQQRPELAALKASGISGRLLVGMVLAQGAVIGVLGGVLGIAATPPTVEMVNHVAESISGFPNLVKTPAAVLALGLGVALVMGVLGASVAGWRVARLSPLAGLEE